MFICINKKIFSPIECKKDFDTSQYCFYFVIILGDWEFADHCAPYREHYSYGGG